MANSILTPTAVTREALRATVSEMEAGGDAAVRKSGWRHAFRVKRQPEDMEALIAGMVNGFREREASDLARLDQVMALASGKGCMTKALLKHFGEKLEEPCGHCDRCRGIPPVRPKRRKPRRVSETELAKIRELADENHAALGNPRQVARFLCGMSSPASMRARLYRHDAYGMLSDLPFAEVMVVAESFF